MGTENSQEENNKIFSHPTPQDVSGILRHIGQPIKVTLVWEKTGKRETHVFDFSTQFTRRHQRGIGLWMQKADQVIVSPSIPI